ncbi:hypothetical protein D3C81_1751780 [compost metagenome]
MSLVAIVVNKEHGHCAILSKTNRFCAGDMHNIVGSQASGWLYTGNSNSFDILAKLCQLHIYALCSKCGWKRAVRLCGCRWRCFVNVGNGDWSRPTVARIVIGCHIINA